MLLVCCCICTEWENRVKIEDDDSMVEQMVDCCKISLILRRYLIGKDDQWYNIIAVQLFCEL